VHGNFRALRVFLRWIEAEEIIPPEWKNPIRRVKPPRVDIPPIDPIPLEDVKKLLDCCTQGDYAERDRASGGLKSEVLLQFVKAGSTPTLCANPKDFHALSRRL